MILLLIILFVLFLIAVACIIFPLYSAKRHFYLAVFLILMLAIWGGGAYYALGGWKALSQVLVQEQQVDSTQKQIQAIGGEHAVVEKLKARLQTDPNQPEGWYLLGRIYFSQNKFHAAIEAFQKANRLAPGRVDVLMALAESSYLSSLQSDQKQAAHYLQSVLQQDPKNIAALNLSALILYKQKKYAQAVEIWQDLLLRVPADSEESRAIEAALNNAKKELMR